jgi:hypothetical protein
MGNKGVFTKILAITGTVLVWLPLLAPVLLALGALFTGSGFLLDYLMPAEIFPLALAGGLMLFWAALRMYSRRGWIGWGLVVAVGMWFGFQALAEVTGLASGAHEPEGWRWALVLAGLAIYILALAEIGVGGILLLRKLFRQAQPVAAKP